MRLYKIATIALLLFFATFALAENQAKVKITTTSQTNEYLKTLGVNIQLSVVVTNLAGSATSLTVKRIDSKGVSIQIPIGSFSGARTYSLSDPTSTSDLQAGLYTYSAIITTSSPDSEILDNSSSVSVIVKNPKVIVNVPEMSILVVLLTIGIVFGIISRDQRHLNK
ncbi:MAG TPA: hypothetical protein VJG83_05630 [archaeon]|nr:hypothetical protein [archaeon]